MLLNYHIGCFILGSLCVGDLVRLGLSSVRVACGNSTAQSQAPVNGYINVRNMLSTYRSEIK